MHCGVQVSSAASRHYSVVICQRFSALDEFITSQNSTCTYANKRLQERSGRDPNRPITNVTRSKLRLRYRLPDFRLDNFNNTPSRPIIQLWLSTWRGALPYAGWHSSVRG